METPKIFNQWYVFARKHPWKTLLFGIVSIIIISFVAYACSFVSEKAKQLANPSIQTEKQQEAKQPGDIYQNLAGTASTQFATTGDNSPIIGKVEFKSEQRVDIDHETSSLTENDGIYQRSVIIRNNSINPAYNVHFSIKSEKQIINVPHPWPQGGGAIQINYNKIIGNTYEAEVSTIPPRRYIKIILQSDTEFEIEKVTIY